MGAYPAFLDDPAAKTAWLLELDAFSLAPSEAASGDDPDGTFGSASFGEVSFGEGDNTSSVEVLRYSDVGYTSTIQEEVHRIYSEGAANGKRIALMLDYLAADSLLPVIGEATVTVTRTGATATRVNSQGLIELMAADTARWDYDPATLLRRGLLVEETAIQLALRTEEFDNATWSKQGGCTVDANAATAPDGTLTMDRIRGSSTGSSSCGLSQAFTLAASTTYTLSFFFKADTVDSCDWGLYDVTAVAFRCRARFDASAGTHAANVGSATVLDYEDWGNGVYRLRMTVATSTNTSYRFYIYPRDTNATTSSEAIFAWGANLVASAVMTSYIPATTASVTRNRDVPSFPVGSWFDQDVGTWAAQFMTKGLVSGNPRVVSYNVAPSEAPLSLVTGGTPITAAPASTWDGTDASQTSNTYAVGTVGIMAMAYDKPTDVAISLNGGTVATNGTSDFGTVATVHLGNNQGASLAINGWIQRVMYLAERVSNDALVDIATAWPTTTSSMVATGDPDSKHYYEGRLHADIRIERRVVGREGVGGMTRVFAEVQLINADGALDTLKNDYAIEGRAASLYLGQPDERYANFGRVFHGVVESVHIGTDTVRVRLTDGHARVRRPLNATTYAGTGTLEGGVDLKDKTKPMAFGECLNITPPLVDSTLLIYQVHDGEVNDIPVVYDRGVPLTKGADYANSGELETIAPTAGQYRVYPGGGYFRLGATPAGTITCDVEGDATGSVYVNTTGDIVERILLDNAGLSPSEIDTAALDALNPAPVGIWIGTDGALASDVVDTLLASIGAFGGFSRTGQFTTGTIAAADGSTVDELDEEDIIDIERVPLPSLVEPIVWRASVGYQKNYTVQTDLASSVTAARRSFAAQAMRIEKDEDTVVLSRHVLAQEYKVDGLFSEQADAADEAVRLFALWGVPRGAYRVTMPLHAIQRDLDDIVLLTHTRFGLSVGNAARVIAFTIQGSNVELTVLV